MHSDQNKTENTLYHIGETIGKISGNVDRLLDYQEQQRVEISTINHKLHEHNITMIERVHKLSEDMQLKDKNTSVKIAKWTGFGAGIGAVLTFILKFLRGD
jgi:hypothetical protein